MITFIAFFSLYLSDMNRALFLSIFLFLTFALQAQIPVADEPLHHVIYEDEAVRVLEIIAFPGDTALMHQHDYNYCYLAMKGGKLWLLDKGEESREVNLPDHYCGGKFDLMGNPFVHRFANIDTHPIKFFTIEHKGAPIGTKKAKERTDDVILENDLFMVRKMEVAPLSSLTLGIGSKAFLLNINQSPSLYSSGAEVSYWEHNADKEKLRLSNMSDQGILIAVFEIY